MGKSEVDLAKSRPKEAETFTQAWKGSPQPPYQLLIREDSLKPGFCNPKFVTQGPKDHSIHMQPNASEKNAFEKGKKIFWYMIHLQKSTDRLITQLGGFKHMAIAMKSPPCHDMEISGTWKSSLCPLPVKLPHPTNMTITLIFITQIHFACCSTSYETSIKGFCLDTICHPLKFRLQRKSSELTHN